MEELELERQNSERNAKRADLLSAELEASKQASAGQSKLLDEIRVLKEKNAELHDAESQRDKLQVHMMQP